MILTIIWAPTYISLFLTMYLLLLATIIFWFPPPIVIILTLSYLESLSVSNQKLLGVTYKEFYSQVIWINLEDPSFYSSHLRFQGEDYDSTIQMEVHLSVLPEWDQCHKGVIKALFHALYSDKPHLFLKAFLVSYACVISLSDAEVWTVLRPFNTQLKCHLCRKAIPYCPSWSSSQLLSILAPCFFPSWHFSEVVMIYLFAF